MEAFSLGVWSFVKVTTLLFFIVESSVLLEEFLSSRLELRRGFAGAKTSPFKVFYRHLLKFLRNDGSAAHHFGSAVKFLLVFMAAGLLPSWSGQIALECPHSIWVFAMLTIAGPAFNLIAEWTLKTGAGWPLTLVSAERVLGSATIHFVLATTLAAMTGLDTFSDFRDLQAAHGWLIFKYPWSIFLLFTYEVVNLFINFKAVFSRKLDEKATGWLFDDYLPELRRATWTLFVVDIFLGGAGTTGLLGNIFLLLKCVALNVISVFAAQIFIHLREDQAEAFILWRLTPVAILILAFSLLIPGGLN